MESIKRLPSREIVLETRDNTYYHFKTDIFNRLITYSTSKEMAANLVTISASRAFEVIALNKRGVRPDELDNDRKEEPVQKEFGDVVGQDSLTRFDKNKKKNTSQKKKKKPAKSKNPAEEKSAAVVADAPAENTAKPRNEGKPRNHKPRRPSQKNENKSE